MKLLKIIALVCVFSVVLLQTTFARESAGSGSTGTIVSLTPNVYVTHDGSTIRGKYESRLEPGDTIRTDGNGRVRIRLHDGSVLSLGEYSEVRLAPAALVVERGIVRAELASGSRYEIRSPQSTAITTGGEFLIDATAPADVSLYCVSGTAEIRNEQSRAIQCCSGEFVFFSQGPMNSKFSFKNERQVAVLRDASDPDAPAPFQPLP